MKTVGIIGGMGPAATNHLVLKIIKLFENSGQSSRPHILVDFVPIGINTESELILKNKKGDFLLVLTESAKRLEKSGVDFIVIACNSVHVFINEIMNSVSIPVISVIEEVEKLRLNRFGVIATDFTINNNLFDKVGEQMVVPNKYQQQAINQTINCLVKGFNPVKSDLTTIDSLINNWVQKEVNTCILGCSEMQLLAKMWNKWSMKINFIDTMDVLANETVNNLIN